MRFCDGAVDYSKIEERRLIDEATAAYEAAGGVVTKVSAVPVDWEDLMKRTTSANELRSRKRAQASAKKRGNRKKDMVIAMWKSGHRDIHEIAKHVGVCYSSAQQRLRWEGLL